jgi:tetratricopeptide (TPR) repeat protein
MQVYREDRERKKLMTALIALAGALVLMVLLTGLFLRTPTARYHRSLNLGNRYLLTLQYEDAAEAYTAAIRIDPKSADAYAGRGDAYAGLGRTELARADYIQAVQLNPELEKTIQAKIDALPAPEDAAEPTPEPAAEPTATPTPEATAVPFAGAVRLEDGTAAVSAWTGGQDTITFTNTGNGDYYSGFQIAVNDHVLGADSIMLYKDAAYAVDINPNDGWNNILVTGQGEDVYMCHYLYAYNADEFVLIDKGDTLACIEDIKGDGQVTFYDMAHLLAQPDQFLFFKLTEQVDGKNVAKISETPGHYFSQNGWDLMDGFVQNYQDGYSCSAGSAMAVYSDEACTSQSGTIPEGTSMEVVGRGTQTGQYSLQVTAGGTSGWITGDEMHLLSGYTPFD